MVCLAHPSVEGERERMRSYVRGRGGGGAPYIFHPVVFQDLVSRQSVSTVPH